MPNKLKFLRTPLTILTIALIAYLLLSQKNLLGSRSISEPKPNIVDFFACGDNCPGPAEKYTVKVYEGIKTKEICDKYGGYFKSFVGWGTTYYCAVEKN